MTNLTKSIRHAIIDGKEKMTKEYIAWTAMRIRCNNPKHDKYKFYGGRGITVCDRWQQSFENFYNDMGLAPSPDHQIDRINNNKGYSPENCEWRTRKHQCNNTRRNVRYTYNGENLTLAEWCDRFKLNYKRAWHRINVAGWPLQKAFNYSKQV